MMIQNLWDVLSYHKSNTMREVYSNASLLQNARNIFNDLTLHPKQVKKNNKTQNQEEERSVKIRAEINKIEMKKEKINETKSWFFEQIKLEMKK